MTTTIPTTLDVAGLLDAAADREPAMAALEAAVARLRAADVAIAALLTVAPTDIAATVRVRAMEEFRP